MNCLNELDVDCGDERDPQRIAVRQLAAESALLASQTDEQRQFVPTHWNRRFQFSTIEVLHSICYYYLFY